MHATSGIGCRGVSNAANLEYICNQVWIGSIKKLKGVFGRIALKGSYRIWLARNSKGLNGGELIMNVEEGKQFTQIWNCRQG